MLNSETKRKIDSARNILVGNVTNPISQVDQITNALIYKFMDDMDQENIDVDLKPQFFVGDYAKYAWSKLLDKKLSGQERMNLYIQATENMSKNPHIPQLFRDIFKGAFLPYNDPRVLTLFLKEIDGFSYSHSEELGNAFEYLLSILGSQGEAGMFRTPRHIIDFIAEVVDPKKNETILDPACGTAGFLISAYKHILKNHDGLDNKTGKPTNKEKNLTPDEKTKLMNNIVGYDVSPDMVKLSLVNMYLHGFQSPKIHKYNTLTDEKRWDEQFDVIMANPPFMTPKGGVETHKRFSIQANRAEVLFVDYIMEHLSINGRAGIIVPEGIIFKGDKAYKALRKKLVEDGLFAVVSLPAGVFQPYSGVKTSILFFDNQVAKQTNEMLFVKIENDGYDLGAQRRKIDKNDLLYAVEILGNWKKGNKDSALNNKNLFACLVGKDEIAEDGEYHLGGERYKTRVEKLIGDIEYRINFLNGIFKVFVVKNNIKEKIKKESERFEKKIVQNYYFNQLPEKLKLSCKELNNILGTNDIDGIKKSIEKIKNFISKQQKWDMVELREVLEYEQPTKYIVESVNYSDDYKTPVLTAGKTFLLGYTNETEGIMPVEKLPVIIFDDFTTAIKFVDFPFKVKSSAMKILHIDRTKAEPRYLFEVMKTIKFRHDDHKRYWISEFSKIKIPLPPLSVQKEIVEQIEVKQNAINHAREIIKNLERERQYFGQELRKLKDVEIVELGEVCEFIGGYAFKSGELKKEKNSKKDLPVIKIGNVDKSGILNLTDTQYFEYQDFLKKYLINKDNILIAMTGATVGKVAHSQFDNLLLNQRVGLVKADEKKMLKSFLKNLLLSDKFYQYCQNVAGGGAQGNISPTQIKKYKIPLPPLATQKQLVAEAQKEEEIITANKRLIEIMEKKIEKVISEI